MADLIPLNDLSRADAASRSEAVAALTRVAASGWYLQGPEREGFESAFASYLGVRHCVGVANGTDAIELALRGIGCVAGDEVLTAANAGTYSTSAALRAGLIPRYADIDPATLCLSAETVEAALTPGVRAVVVTHLYGQMAEVGAIAGLCRARSIAVIEDCAQATGAHRDGVYAGAHGDAGVFSFYPTKNLGAFGDAGAVVTGDAEMAARIRALSQYGWKSKYEVSIAGGMNSRMDELQAAILRSRLGKLDGWNDRRRHIALRYSEAVCPDTARLLGGSGQDYVAHLAVLLTPRREALREAMTTAGIETGLHYPIPDHRQPFWRGAYDDVRLPVTEDAVDLVVTLPCFPSLTEGEIDRVCEALRDV